jgi:hypothetical protein
MQQLMSISTQSDRRTYYLTIITLMVTILSPSHQICCHALSIFESTVQEIRKFSLNQFWPYKLNHFQPKQLAKLSVELELERCNSYDEDLKLRKIGYHYYIVGEILPFNKSLSRLIA